MDGIRPFHPTHNYNQGQSADTFRDDKNRHIHNSLHDADDDATSLEHPFRFAPNQSITATHTNNHGRDGDDHPPPPPPRPEDDDNVLPPAPQDKPRLNRRGSVREKNIERQQHSFNRQSSTNGKSHRAWDQGGP